ncbi:cytochrome P450 [Dentipellis sp. KUC8613]|nr:cytochrome P450 [Dentipellis sp. KUC8613]
MDTQIAALFCFVVFITFTWHCRSQNLPPGPPAGFFGDHRLQVPDFEPYKKFAEWSKQYGPIIMLWLGWTPVLVLQSYQIANDLLNKRGEIYSSRPRSIVGQEILADNMRILGMPYGDKWRKMRKVQYSGLNERYAIKYREFQSLESAVLIQELCGNPSLFSLHFQRFATSVVFAISYGKRVVSMDDPVVKDSRAAANAFASTLIPGRFIVESWPFLLWLPRSLQWFRWAQERQKQLDIKLYVGLFREVKHRMDEGVAKSSMSRQMYQDESLADMSEVELAYSAAGPFSAGIGTVSSALDVFVLAMIHHPECVLRAQEELDNIVGTSRMPTFADADSLPYVCALIKETMRWRVIAPTAVAHSTTSDDTYEGYHIPKGATVYGNLYSICHDHTVFTDPSKFMPERFLETKDPMFSNFELPYGFGRRICPGRHVANQSLFIVISRMLWSFNFAPHTDQSGKHILPDPDAFTSGLVRRPEPFKCRLTPRSRDIEQILSSEAAQSAIFLKEWE